MRTALLDKTTLFKQRTVADLVGSLASCCELDREDVSPSLCGRATCFFRATPQTLGEAAHSITLSWKAALPAVSAFLTPKQSLHEAQPDAIHWRVRSNTHDKPIRLNNACVRSSPFSQLTCSGDEPFVTTLCHTYLWSACLNAVD